MLAGNPADGEDTWLRSVTNTKHLRKGGGVHHAQFKKWLGPPDDVNAGWKLELSGRLLSLVNSIGADARMSVEAQKNKGADEILTVIDALLENLVFVLPDQLASDQALSIRP